MGTCWGGRTCTWAFLAGLQAAARFHYCTAKICRLTKLKASRPPFLWSSTPVSTACNPDGPAVPSSTNSVPAADSSKAADPSESNSEVVLLLLRLRLRLRYGCCGGPHPLLPPPLPLPLPLLLLCLPLPLSLLLQLLLLLLLSDLRIFPRQPKQQKQKQARTGPEPKHCTPRKT